VTDALSAAVGAALGYTIGRRAREIWLDASGPGAPDGAAR
jgi:hypothetical protein